MQVYHSDPVPQANPSSLALHSTSPTVDPTINLLFLKMKSELEQAKDKLEQAQNELSAWRFMPDR